MSKKNSGWYGVEIVAFKNDAVERRIGPYMNKRQAERAECGVVLNIDYKRFFTRIVDWVVPVAKAG